MVTPVVQLRVTLSHRSRATGFGGFTGIIDRLPFRLALPVCQWPSQRWFLGPESF